MINMKYLNGFEFFSPVKGNRWEVIDGWLDGSHEKYRCRHWDAHRCIDAIYSREFIDSCVKKYKKATNKPPQQNKDSILLSIIPYDTPSDRQILRINEKQKNLLDWLYDKGYLYTDDFIFIYADDTNCIDLT